MKDRKAVVTGIGIICAAGAGREALREALRKPAPLTADAGLRLPAGLVRNFDIREYIETEKGYLDRTSQLAFAGMSLALEDANLSREDVQKAEAGLFLGTAFGNHQTMALFFEDLLAKGPIRETYTFPPRLLEHNNQPPRNGVRADRLAREFCVRRNFWSCGNPQRL